MDDSPTFEAAVPLSDDGDPTHGEGDHHGHGLGVAMSYAVRQGLAPRRLAAVALFALVTHALAHGVPLIEDELSGLVAKVGHTRPGGDEEEAMGVALAAVRIERVSDAGLSRVVREALAAGYRPIVRSLDAEVESVGASDACASGDAAWFVLYAEPGAGPARQFGHSAPLLAEARLLCFAYPGPVDTAAIAQACGTTVPDVVRNSAFPNALAPPTGCTPGGSCIALTLHPDECRAAILSAAREDG